MMTFYGFDADGQENTHGPWTVYDTGEEHKNGLYTDRFLQWDWDKHDKLCMKHFGDKGHYWDNRDPKDIQAFLRDWCNDKKLVLVKIVKYINMSNGYPTWCLCYR